jgi:predicted nucleic acid-binding protein
VNILVDTSVWSLLLRRKRSTALSASQASALQELKELVQEDRAHLTGAIRQELLTGIRTEAEFEELQFWLSYYEDLPADSGTHELAARYANKCLDAGVSAGAVDLLIVAIAVRNSMTVFTLDKDFQHIQRVVPIRLHGAK